MEKQTRFQAVLVISEAVQRGVVTSVPPVALPDPFSQRCGHVRFDAAGMEVECGSVCKSGHCDRHTCVPFDDDSERPQDIGVVSYTRINGLLHYLSKELPRFWCMYDLMKSTGVLDASYAATREGMATYLAAANLEEEIRRTQNWGVPRWIRRLREVLGEVLVKRTPVIFTAVKSTSGY